MDTHYLKVPECTGNFSSDMKRKGDDNLKKTMLFYYSTFLIEKLGT